MARSAVARATCAAGARRDRLSRESVICSPSLNARSGSFCRLDIGHLTTRHVASMADLVPNHPLVVAWTSFWWLEFYPEFFEHLRSKYRQILRSDRTLV